MPIGVYDRSVRLTAEQIRERKADCAKRHAAENREKIAIYQKQYRDKNRERLAAHQAANNEHRAVNQKTWRAANPDYKVEYRELNHKKLLAQEKAWRAANPGLASIKNGKRLTRKGKVTVGDLAAMAEWEAKWRSRKIVVCHWCRKRVKTSDVHIDHVIPLSKGGPHAVENLCVSCRRCNLSKQAKLPEVWNAGLSQPLLFV